MEGEKQSISKEGGGCENPNPTSPAAQAKPTGELTELGISMPTPSSLMCEPVDLAPGPLNPLTPHHPLHPLHPLNPLSFSPPAASAPKHPPPHPEEGRAQIPQPIAQAPNVREDAVETKEGEEGGVRSSAFQSRPGHDIRRRSSYPPASMAPVHGASSGNATTKRRRRSADSGPLDQAASEQLQGGSSTHSQQSRGTQAGGSPPSPVREARPEAKAPPPRPVRRGTEARGSGSGGGSGSFSSATPSPFSFVPPFGSASSSSFSAVGPLIHTDAMSNEMAGGLLDRPPTVKLEQPASTVFDVALMDALSFGGIMPSLLPPSASRGPRGCLKVEPAAAAAAAGGEGDHRSSGRMAQGDHTRARVASAKDGNRGGLGCREGKGQAADLPEEDVDMPDIAQEEGDRTRMSMSPSFGGKYLLRSLAKPEPMSESPCKTESPLQMQSIRTARGFGRWKKKPEGEAQRRGSNSSMKSYTSTSPRSEAYEPSPGRRKGSYQGGSSSDEEKVVDIDPHMWYQVERGSQCMAEDCVYRDKVTHKSNKRHYHSRCDHRHTAGAKKGMKFHHHQMEKLRKHQGVHLKSARRAGAAPQLTEKVIAQLDAAGLEYFQASQWTEADMAMLNSLVEKHGNHKQESWDEVSKNFKKVGRDFSPMQCLLCYRYTVAPNKIIKGVRSFTPMEDDRLRRLAGLFGSRWAYIVEFMPGRLGKQCRERFLNRLDPRLKKTAWTKEEDEKISALYSQYNGNFPSICKHMPGRAYIDVRQRYKTLHPTSRRPKGSNVPEQKSRQRQQQLQQEAEEVKLEARQAAPAKKPARRKKAPAAKKKRKRQQWEESSSGGEASDDDEEHSSASDTEVEEYADLGKWLRGQR
ncbi:unnamed protein product [Chrysoparadoxa australica]